jgi:hypothetical protein
MLTNHSLNKEIKPEEKKFWFPAKRYGWGWGPPNCWQGWLVIMVYVALVSSGAFLFPPDKHPALFAVNLLIFSAALIFVCFLKGEKPGWRWDGK